MKQLKFKLGQFVQGVRSGKVFKIVGLDRSEETVVPYLVQRFDDGGAEISERWLQLCTDKLQNILGMRGSWLGANDLKVTNLIPDGPVYTPNIKTINTHDDITISGADLVFTLDRPGKKEPVYLRRFESGAVRSDDRGRENPAFISPYALKFLAQHFSKNASEFNGNDSAKNYMKGIKPKDIEASLERHMLDFKFAMLPNRRDNINGIKTALVEIMANCVMGLHQIGLEEDGDYVEKYDRVEYIKKEDNI